MPYIKPERREVLDQLLRPLTAETPYLGIGEINYVITRILLGYRPANYEDYNALVGVLECAKLELYRRRIAEYEDKKALENGEVF